MRVFLLTSFPTLMFDAQAPISMEDVMSRCGDHLSASEMQEIEAFCFTPPEGTSDFAKEWSEIWSFIHAWNQQQRLASASTESDRESGASDSQVRHDLLQAWEEPDPLKRERALLQTEWNWLDRKRRLSPYSMNDLYGYILQTKLLERKDRWEEQAGLTQFQSHVGSFLEPVLEDLQEAHT